MKKHILGLLMLTGLLVTACSKESDAPHPYDTKERTFFIYMAADNSLNGYSESNIRTLLSSLSASDLAGTNVVIYQDKQDAHPKLMHVVMDGSSAKTRVVEQYGEHNSATPEVLSQVISSVIWRFPAETYGFVMWSHGTGWLPSNPDYTSRAIGQDGSTWIDIGEFASAIPANTFDYILMDACYMAGVEVAYALRDKTDWVVAAPTEIMADGMPYHKMATLLFGKNPNLEGFCDAFYDHYAAKGLGSTVSLIDTRYLNGLASVVKGILADTSWEEITEIETSSMQYFDRLVTSKQLHPYHVFFDLGDFIERIASPLQYPEFTSVLEQVVPYYRHSDSFLKNQSGFLINRYSGLSVYVPRSGSYMDHVNRYYKTTDWYQSVY